MRKLVNTVLAGALGLSMIAGVSAQDSGDATVSITADDPTNVLTVLISNASFGNHPYSLSAQTVDAEITVNVDDLRGTNAGWTVNLNADGDLDPAGTGDAIPLEGLSLGAPVVSTDIPPVGLPAADISTFALDPVSTTDQPILAAEAGEGAGEYEFDIAGSLVIPAGQVVDSYSATLTISTAAAP